MNKDAKIVGKYSAGNSKEFIESMDKHIEEVRG